MERLRPVYETGVLRLLLRGNSMLYVALLRSTFDPLTGELPREIVEERFSRSLTRLAETGDYTPKEGQTSAEAAHTILQQLTKEGEGDYAWLANSLDVASHRYLYRLTARAHRAIEALDRLEDTTKALSGAQANSIIMEIEHARMQLTADPRERIRLLERDIEERQKQIDELKHSDTLDKLTSQQVGDIIGVIHTRCAACRSTCANWRSRNATTATICAEACSRAPSAWSRRSAPTMTNTTGRSTNPTAAGVSRTRSR